jgi:hypothetical protein
LGLYLVRYVEYWERSRQVGITGAAGVDRVAEERRLVKRVLEEARIPLTPTTKL